jgi:tripartite-type tricarboxylate transporter receptor subunit TctC
MAAIAKGWPLADNRFRLNRRADMKRMFPSFSLMLCFAMPAAQPYPERPIRLIVPASPGTGSDFFGRTVAQALTEIYKQQIVADNRAGAGGLIGAQLIAAANPDGYTIGMASSSLLVSPLFQAKPQYRPIEDFSPIALLSSITSVVAVAPSLPVKSVQELVAYAKARPGQLNFPSVGTGTAAHLSAEIFNKAGGISAVHIPFKSVADVFTEMFAGRVHYMVFVAPAVTPMVRDGKLRPLAVTSKTRSTGLPDVPTVIEAGLPAAEVDTLFGVVAPARTPPAVIKKLHADILSVLQRAETKERFQRQGGSPAVDTTPEKFAAQLKTEYERYRKLIPEIGIKPQ